MSKPVPFDTTLHVRDHCLCLHAQRAARVLARRFDEALRPVGLTNQQFSLLMSLNRPKAPTIGVVAELLGMDRTTLTAALKPLERRGWRQPPSIRPIAVAATSCSPRKEALLAEAVPIWRDTHAAVERSMVGVDVDRLRHDLGTIV
ncbi:MarR family winged helix-turn-helix transcriptional regulator [Rhizorhabdus histidinilytica]